MFYAGAAYLFDAATGNLLGRFDNPVPTDYSFGDAVAISNSVAVVGTPYADGIAIDRGAAYAFDVDRPPTVTNVSVGSSRTAATVAIPVGSGANCSRCLERCRPDQSDL